MAKKQTGLGRHAENILGERFGRWTVEARAGTYRGEALWLCRCDCGTTRDVRGRQMKNGNSKSCGCLRKIIPQTTSRKHGHARHDARHPEYGIWCHVVSRCHNVRSKHYDLYGGRGIAMHPAWRRSFEVFIRDMGPRPSRWHSIDRINNDGNYEPGNCRWATAKEQQRNKSDNRIVTIRGEPMCISEAAQRYGFKVACLWARWNRGDSGERLIRPLRGSANV